MSLILHTPEGNSELIAHYQRAFRSAVELFIVTAYLTEWDSSLELNPNCLNFRIIIGKDFGITRRYACEKVMRWLPPGRKYQFMVADRIDGFHPKAVFWKEQDGNSYAIVGSSNLTRAAFETNYEANIYCPLPEADYAKGKRWVKQIEKQSVPVSGDWLRDYKEASAQRKGNPKRGHIEPKASPLVAFDLPTPNGSRSFIKQRRKQLAEYKNRVLGS